MKISINSRKFSDPELAEAQSRIIDSIESNIEYYINQYNNDMRSFSGRYICSDLFKEMFSEYSKSKESRTRFNIVVHNSAAVLSAEQFDRKIAANGKTEKNKAIFLTGIPGSGKSTFIGLNGLPPDVRIIFEGQMWRPETSIPKIEKAISAGIRPTIMVFHCRPEDAFKNTYDRYLATGQGAGIEVMAQCQGHLADGLLKVKEQFGEAVDLVIADQRDPSSHHILHGWDNIDILRSEGDYGRIVERLTIELHKQFAAGKIKENWYKKRSAGLPDVEIDQSPPIADFGKKEGVLISHAYENLLNDFRISRHEGQKDGPSFVDWLEACCNIRMPENVTG